MGWLGLFSDTPAPRFGSVLDALAKTLHAKMSFQPGERDMIMLQHKFDIELADGRKVCCDRAWLCLGNLVELG